MPAWKNTDAFNSQGKPRFAVERNVREFYQLTVATGGGNTAGNTIITVTAYDGGPSTLANIGVAAGQYVYFWATGLGANGGQAGNGVPGFFQSNTTVASVSGNTVTLANALFNTVSSGYIVEFDKKIVYNPSKNVASVYNGDTILVTPTRLANATVSIGDTNSGWAHIQRKVNNDGTVRYITETLVALASPTATNIYSANIVGSNTSTNPITIFTGI
jgi:hypothetical protein